MTIDDSPYTRELFKGFNITGFTTSHTAGNNGLDSYNNKDGKGKELLVSNYTDFSNKTGSDETVLTEVQPKVYNGISFNIGGADAGTGSKSSTSAISSIDDLKLRPVWVCWRSVHDKHGKAKKIPIDPKTGDVAKSNDPSTWGRYEEAEAALVAGDYDGIGFMFASTGVCGIDLDAKDGKPQMTQAVFLCQVKGVLLSAGR